jgi:predicted amino acid dehydrogenase
MPALALIGHLESAEAYRQLLSGLRGDDLPPLGLSELESVRGITLRARYIDVGLLPDLRVNARAALRRVASACAEAEAAGARLAVLGGFTSIAARCGRLPLFSGGLALTTGATLTAAVITEQVAALLGDLRGVTLTVVGAAGEVGSGVSRLLHARGARLLLVGRKRRPIEDLAAELAGSRASAWTSAASISDVVVLVASAVGSISLEGVPAGSVIFDAGHPPNAVAAVGRRQYALAGRVVHELAPEPELPALVAHRYAPGETHACLAEGVTRAYEGRFEDASMSERRPLAERAAELLALAARHGLRPAPLGLRSAAAPALPTAPWSKVKLCPGSSAGRAGAGG